ncbi:MAG: hypothetical protein KGH57_01490 [Candidatus Micrarchaeota archaeon]|nr:hypothetical protein [Candidatus Micrarchaeota archaeon]
MSTKLVGERRVQEVGELAWATARKELHARFEPPMLWDTSDLAEVSRRSERELRIVSKGPRVEKFVDANLKAEGEKGSSLFFDEGYAFFSTLIPSGDSATILLHGVVPPRNSAASEDALDYYFHTLIEMALQESNPFWTVASTQEPNAVAINKFSHVVADAITYQNSDNLKFSTGDVAAKKFARIAELISKSHPAEVPLELLKSYLKETRGEKGVAEFNKASESLEEDISFSRHATVLRRGQMAWQMVR